MHIIACCVHWKVSILKTLISNAGQWWNVAKTDIKCKFDSGWWFYFLSVPNNSLLHCVYSFKVAKADKNAESAEKVHILMTCVRVCILFECKSFCFFWELRKTLSFLFKVATYPPSNVDTKAEQCSNTFSKKTRRAETVSK